MTGGAEIGSLWGGVLWIAGLVAGTALIGFYGAMVVFFLVFLLLRARAPPLQVLLLTVLASGFLAILANALTLNFPAGVLQSYVELPWPLR